MKLSLLTFNLGKDFTLDELIGIFHRTEIDGIEFRAEADHKHGIELERTPEERAAIKDKCEAAGLPIACIATGCRFESLDDAERQAEIDRAKEYVDLAADVGCERIRVFGNAFPEGSDKDVVIENVGNALREIAEHAAPRGVDVNLEMHGHFSWWEYCLRAVEIADHRNVGIVYNCNYEEPEYGPICGFVDPVIDRIRHVHMHDLERPGWPYPAFISMLKRSGYAGWLSLECSPSPDAERVIAIYAKYFKLMVEAG
ncbi:MAG: sugar phosphate isomerase/epimerase [Armatimonadetes bacterium]|nr:sugar phosphate isomerase/epimerase [Armatimonadota bacterium]